MRTLRFLIAALFVVALNTSANAVPAADQINAAIRNNDYKLVQILVKNNPQVLGQAEDLLLKNVALNIEKQPQSALKTMTVATSMSPSIQAKDAKIVAEDLRKIVKIIVDQALFLCNPEANSNTSEVKVSTANRNSADIKAVSDVLGSTEEIAKLPPIIAVDPNLYSEIGAMRSRCDTEDPLLAQLPNSHIHHFPPDPPPPPPASPD